MNSEDLGLRSDQLRSSQFLSREDISSLWQAEFLVYLIFFKLTFTVTFIISEFSKHSIIFSIVALMDLLGYAGIQRFSIQLNKIYIVALFGNFLFVFHEGLLEKMEMLNVGMNNKAHVIYCVVLFVFALYQVLVHLRFQYFLKSISNLKRNHLRRLIKENNVSIRV
jgi:hypothetical protein